MSTRLLLLPDFLLIVAGYLICRHTALDRPLWDGVERLVYYLLFPVLLFVSIVRQPIHPGALLGFAGCGVAVVSWAEAAVETMTARPNAMRWMALRMIPPERLDGQAAAWNGPLRSPALSGGDGRKRGEC